jgi:integrase
MSKWISAGRSKHGLRYREHATLTTGVGRNKRPLRYYTSVFKWQGKTIEDAYGWENEYKGGANEIEMLALQYKMNRKSQTPPFSHKENMVERKQELLEIERAKQEELFQIEQEERTKFKTMFDEYCDANGHKASLKDEKNYYKNWISPHIGEKLLSEIKLLDLERIRRAMEKAKRAPRSIGYIKSIVRQVYNYAIMHELYDGGIPTVNFLKNQKLDNQRERYLTPEEVNQLFKEIRPVSESTYRICVISMNTGMRFGEISGLQWQQVNVEQGIILVLKSKTKTNRTVHMNESVKVIFQEMKVGEPDDLVFPKKYVRKVAKKNTKMSQISKTFTRAVDKLGLNDGITNRNMKVVFHTLRHSCASWLANSGVDMQVVAKVLGHKSLAMTMRYSHINDTSVKGAMKILDQQAKKEAKIIPLQKSS